MVQNATKWIWLGLRNDFENWCLPIGLDGSNSLNTSFVTRLYFSLGDFGTGVDIGHFCGLA